MPLISRLYVWSLVFESLLFFLVGTQSVTGVAMNFGRLLQIVVVMCSLARATELFLTRRVRFGSATNRNYVLFLALAVAAGLYGMLSGTYDVPSRFAEANTSAVSALLNSPYVRPLFEYFIYVYYFIYFVVLPKYFLRDEKAVRYFFRIFSAAFVASFVVGWADILLQAAGTGLYLPREIFTLRNVGLRFHGFAGEPRDAVVYLFFGLAMLHLRQLVTRQKLRKSWVVAICMSALMTQSASGLVGVAFFVAMYAARSYFTAITPRKVVLVPLVVVGALAALYGLAVTNYRISLYVDLLSSAYDILRKGGEIPPLLAVQVNNFFPLYKSVMNLITFNWWPVIFGSGLGSSSSVNLLIGAQFGLDFFTEATNPHSQLVRLVYEAGLLGTYLFYRAFVVPVERLASGLGKVKMEQFVSMMLLVLGCFFAHRNSAAFIYLGIFVAVARVSFPSAASSVERRVSGRAFIATHPGRA